MNRYIGCILVSVSVAFGQNSIYGPSGLDFVPGAFASSGGEWSGAVGGTTDDSPIFVGSIQRRFLDGRLELGLGNAWRMVEGDSVGWNPGILPLPVVPSAKWIVDRETIGRQSWGYAVGVSMPIGVWAAAGWRLSLPLVTPEIHLGLGTPLNSLQAFGGVAIDLCDLDGNVLPVRLIADGSLAGSTGTLGRTEEAFGSLGVETRLGRNLSFQVVHRRDRSYHAPEQGNRKGGVSFLRVLWNFGARNEGVAR